MPPLVCSCPSCKTGNGRAGWIKAYGEFFNNAQNPSKTARSTVAVTGLVSPDWLIKIEAFAVYPAAP
ncbi:MAG: hypothetical protein EXS42_01375 [Lacunisphaera sp.]|nr:hypothetical protein [Lacunisphaera sp.]